MGVPPGALPTGRSTGTRLQGEGSHDRPLATYHDGLSASVSSMSPAPLAPVQLQTHAMLIAPPPLPRLGQTLIDMGCITEPDLACALSAQRQSTAPLLLGEQLLQEGRISALQLDAALNRRLGFRWVDVLGITLQPQALAQLPLTLCRRLKALPIERQAGQLLVAMADPKRQADIDQLAWAAECWIQPVLADHQAIQERLDEWAQQVLQASSQSKVKATPADSPLRTPVHPAGNGARNLLPANLASTHQWLAEIERQASADASASESEPLAEESEHALVKLINGLILDAHALGASDIHVECRPGRERVRIRLRRDGYLQDFIELPPAVRAALVARLKIMSGLDVSERRRPQDGRIAFGRPGIDQPLELRVVTIPTQQGLEDVVLRVLGSSEPMPLERLGLHPRNLQRFRQAIERPHGLILCAGPTGSGKTTTLHSALAHLNTPGRKIWTAEDPIEITQAGLRQVQVNPRLDWTFEKALRSFLRADPDVIMVGEIRDRETARTAVEAALTGHLVLSTIHTNSAAETITRLLDMGLDPFNFGDSLLAVMGQRLVRRWCPSCVESRAAPDAQVQAWWEEHQSVPGSGASGSALEGMEGWKKRLSRDGPVLHHHAPGCAACEGSGYQGRIGLHELLVVTPEIRRLIQRREPLEGVLELAIQQGLITLKQDGIEKVLQGQTSMDEVRAHVNL